MHADKVAFLLIAAMGAGCATSEPELVPDRHDRPIVERDGRTLLWAGDEEWFDVTDSTIDPHRFQFGIGKDTIASIDQPVFVDPQDPRAVQAGISAETPVIGVAIDGEARAYPVDVMDYHEVVNDRFGGGAYAVLW
jgi:hypothetical protein